MAVATVVSKFMNFEPEPRKKISKLGREWDAVLTQNRNRLAERD